MMAPGGITKLRDISRRYLLLGNVNALQWFHVLRQAALILTSIILAKSALSTEAIGHWELLLYIGYTLSFFWVSGLVQGMLTMYPKLEETDRKVFIFNVYILFFLISLLLFFILLWLREPVIYLLTRHRDLPHLTLFSIFLALNLPVFLLENLYLLHNRPKSILSFGIFSAVGQVLCVAVPVWVGEGIGGGVAGLAILAAVRHFFLLKFVIQNSIIRWATRLWKRLISLSLPLMGYSVLGGFQAAFGSWLVAYFYPGDESQFAIFRYGAQELPFAIAITSAFGAAMLPQIAQNLPQALDEIRRKSLRLFHWLFPATIIIMLSSKFIFPLVFRDAFADSVPIFNIFLLISATRMVFSRTVLVGLEANNVVLWVSAIELAVFVVLGLALGAAFGLTGIAVATLAAFTLEKILLCGFLYKRFGVGVGAYTELRWLGIYTGLILAAYSVTTFLL
jgi:O-antigen/teichoic acid export membrane protein